MRMQAAYIEMGSSRSKWVPSRIQAKKKNLTPLETRMTTKSNRSTLDWRVKIKRTWNFLTQREDFVISFSYLLCWSSGDKVEGEGCCWKLWTVW